MATVAHAYWAAAAIRPPVIETIVPTSQKAGQTWRYVTQQPPENWCASDFDDSSWRSGEGGFGNRDTPGAIVRTLWTTSDIWLRRTFTVPEDAPLQGLHLLVHHDEDAEIYLNGRLVSRLPGYTTAYTYRPLGTAAAGALAPGTNVLAVHVRQTTGGQYIDAGIASVGRRTQK
jgi:hypothetical protein